MTTARETFIRQLAIDGAKQAEQRQREQEFASVLADISHRWDSDVVPVVDGVVELYNSEFCEAGLPRSLVCIHFPADQTFFGSVRSAVIHLECSLERVREFYVRINAKGVVELSTPANMMKVYGSVQLEEFSFDWLAETLAIGLTEKLPRL